MCKAFKVLTGLMVAGFFTTAQIPAASALSITLEQGESLCGPPKGLGCGGCWLHSGKCYTVQCDDKGCELTVFRRGLSTRWPVWLPHGGNVQ
jgi:hypothetical protein